MSKISKPTALHTDGTAQVSEWFPIFLILPRNYTEVKIIVESL